MKYQNSQRFKAVLSRVAAMSVAWTVFAGNAFGTEMALELERSADLRSWESVPITADMLSEDGKVILPDDEITGSFRLRIAAVPEGMVLIEGGTLPAVSGLGELNVSTFEIGRHQVTWGEWKEVRAYATEYGYDIGNVGAGCADDHPVSSVSWYDVVKWCNLKSEIEGLAPVYSVSGFTYRSGEFGTDGSHVVERNISANGYRLPGEAEWEFAARGGNESQGYIFSGSNDLREVGWYRDNSGGAACDLYEGRGTWPVGQKAPNELGLYDMSGNVWEWCWGRYSDFSRHVRGGSGSNYASLCAVSYRNKAGPDFRFNFSGFRLARSSGQ